MQLAPSANKSIRRARTDRTHIALERRRRRLRIGLRRRSSIWICERERARARRSGPSEVNSSAHLRPVIYLAAAAAAREEPPTELDSGELSWLRVAAAAANDVSATCRPQNGGSPCSSDTIRCSL